MSDIENYYNKLKEKINDKELNDFWVLCNKTDFKPFQKNVSKTAIKKLIKEDIDNFSKKYLANISIVFKPKINFDKIKPDDKILTIKIYIYLVSKDGKIDTSIADTWSLTIHYSLNELENNKFSMTELDKMVESVRKKKVISDLVGISYTDWINNKKKSIKRSSKKKSKKRSKK